MVESGSNMQHLATRVRDWMDNVTDVAALTALNSIGIEGDASAQEVVKHLMAKAMKDIRPKLKAEVDALFEENASRMAGMLDIHDVSREFLVDRNAGEFGGTRLATLTALLKKKFNLPMSGWERVLAENAVEKSKPLAPSSSSIPVVDALTEAVKKFCAERGTPLMTFADPVRQNYYKPSATLRNLVRLLRRKEPKVAHLQGLLAEEIMQRVEKNLPVPQVAENITHVKMPKAGMLPQWETQKWELVKTKKKKAKK